MNFQICLCGIQAGYVHKFDCPFPLYQPSPEREKEWMNERAKLRATKKHIEKGGRMNIRPECIDQKLLLTALSAIANGVTQGIDIAGLAQDAIDEIIKLDKANKELEDSKLQKTLVYRQFNKACELSFMNKGGVNPMPPKDAKPPPPPPPQRSTMINQYNPTAKMLEVYRLMIDHQKEKNWFDLAKNLAVAIVMSTLIAEETEKLPHGTILLALIGKMNDEIEDAEKRGLFARKENGNGVNKIS